MLASDNVILGKEEPVLPGMVLNVFPSIELEAKKAFTLKNVCISINVYIFKMIYHVVLFESHSSWHYYVCFTNKRLKVKYTE